MKWWSNITGGKCNVVPRIYSAIGGGTFNCITSSPNTASCYSFIGGGSCNVVSVGCSAILGGVGNTVSGSYSAVIGGCGNTVTHNWATASGYNIVSQRDCAFHANIFYSMNMQPYTGAAPGQLQYIIAPAVLGLLPGTCLVAIS